MGLRRDFGELSRVAQPSGRGEGVRTACPENRRYIFFTGGMKRECVVGSGGLLPGPAQALRTPVPGVSDGQIYGAAGIDFVGSLAGP